MISFQSTGSFDRTESFLKKVGKGDIYRNLNNIARKGTAALAAATPKETGVSAASWKHEVTKDRGGYSISWSNSDTVNGTPIVIMLQYGHGTGTGGYVRGRDFINPAVRPVFDQILNDVWRAVTSA